MVMRGYADRKDRVGDSFDTVRDIVKWRAENDVDHLLDRRFKDQKRYHAAWPSYVTGTDDNGHLVNFERVCANILQSTFFHCCCVEMLYIDV
jgi:hypothetical protein